MARSVEDAAAILTGMAGSDPADPATVDADKHKADYTKGLTPEALKGRRIGVLRPDFVTHPALAPIYAAALARLKAAGAVLVEVKTPSATGVGANEFVVLTTELKADMNAYLASTDPAKVKTRTLADLIAFNDRTPRETVLFGQETFLTAEKTKGLDDPAYLEALKTSRTNAREALDKALGDDKLDALVSLTAGPTTRNDAVKPNGGFGSVSTLPAVAGYPHLTVPAGQVQGLPVGLSFIGPAWSEVQLLSFGYAFQEQGARFVPPTFRPSVEDTPAVRAAFAPVKQ
jgi:amidase